MERESENKHLGPFQKDVLDRLERIIEILGDLVGALRRDHTEATWEVTLTRSNPTEAPYSPGPGWEPMAYNGTVFYWKRRRR